MITAAVILMGTGYGHEGKTPAVHPMHPLGGLTLLERAILTVERAGARTWGAALGAHVFWLMLLWLLWWVREKLWDIDGSFKEG